MGSRGGVCITVWQITGTAKLERHPDGKFMAAQARIFAILVT
jgi:hypothetical protein